MAQTKTKPNKAVSGDSWFTVDKAGLAQLLARKHGKLHAVVELISNAWDAPQARRVAVELRAQGRLEKPTGSTRYILSVVDDDPDGFADLTHAYTVFAPSTKKGDALKRGRFNLGEKLVLALCDEATITTTKGQVRFSPDGQRVVDPQERREAGSEFLGIMEMSAKDAEDTVAGLAGLIPPEGIATTINGRLLEERHPARSFKASLKTEVADEASGKLRRTDRVGEVQIYEPHDGEQAFIYEMGIPVVASNGLYHVNVMQKVPLNMDRDNVTPAYARDLHVHVMNAAFDILPAEQFKTAWARTALGDERISTEATEASVKARFGDKVVAFDPNDPEANRLAASQGFVVVHGGSLSKDEWRQAKEAGAIKPAGQVTPSPTVEFHAGGGEDASLPKDDWTDGMMRLAAHCEAFAAFADLGQVTVNMVSMPLAGYLAACGSDGRLIFNYGRLGRRWFEEIGEAQDALMLHELGHIRCGHEGGHLSADYPDEIARLGARLARWYAAGMPRQILDAAATEMVGR